MNLKEKIIIRFTNILGAISFIVLPLNYLAGIVGGIWLLLLGSWEFVLLGILFVISMPFIYSLTFLFSAPLTMVSSYFYKKKKKILTYIFVFGGNIISNLVISYWVFFVFKFFMSYSTTYNHWAFILWGYSTMLAPLAKMARAEGPNNFSSTLSVWLAIICYLILTASLFLSSPSYSLLIIPSIVFTFVNIIFTSLMLDSSNSLL